MTDTTDYRPATQQRSSTVAGLLNVLGPQIARALPKGMDADRIARLVMTEITKSRNAGGASTLDQCTQESFAGALLTSSALGLEPGVQGECYLIPYRDKRRGVVECQLIIGYQGIVKLFWQHPRAQGIRAEAVYSNDTVLEYTKGTGGRFRYQPALGDRGDVLAYYAEVSIAGVREPLWDVFTPEEIKTLRRGKVGSSGDIPDPQHWMERKTALKQVLKLAPKTTRLDTAMRADEQLGTELATTTLPAIGAGVPDGYVDGDVESAPAAVDAAPPPPPADEPPAAPEVAMISRAQISHLGRIRKSENHDAASWSEFVKNTTGVEVADDKLTAEQAGRIIEMFEDVK